MRRRLPPTRFQGVVIGVSLAAALAVPSPLDDLPPPIEVRVRGEVRYVPPTMTLGRAVARFSLRPKAGDLLDVEGEVLRDKAFPGSVVLNGRPAGPGIRLAEGDRIAVVNGRDRTEPVVKEARRVAGTRPSNPQFFLGSPPGVRIVTRGKISGKVASVVFRPFGPVRSPPAVALTFDDGPSPVYTPQVLSILERMDARATFFVVGYLARTFPSLIRRMVDGGMAVANHSYSHPQSPPFKDLPTAEMEGQIRRANEAIHQAGATAHLFRPPGGSYSPEVVGVARRLGLRLVMWSVDPQDWADGATAPGIVQTVLSSVRPGSIVLLHDGGGDQSATVAALPQIISGIRARGLRLVPIAA